MKNEGCCNLLSSTIGLLPHMLGVGCLGWDGKWCFS
jgi:hypothetical protein